MENSSAPLSPEIQALIHARGTRLRLLRKLSGLSRRQLKEKYGFSANTLQNWEGGKYGGLTAKGAERIVQVFRQVGIQCTVAWLLHGIGNKPTAITGVADLDTPAPYDVIRKQLPEDAAILNELQTFRNHYDDAIDMHILDNAMTPHYQEGDVVAGRRRYGDDITSTIGQVCIVETVSGEIYLRQVRKSKTAGLYNLACTNLQSEISLLMLYDIPLHSAAPVIWHRRKDPR